LSNLYKFFPLPGQACPEPVEGKGVRGMVERVVPESGRADDTVAAAL
jgi:hypothetical protein